MCASAVLLTAFVVLLASLPDQTLATIPADARAFVMINEQLDERTNAERLTRVENLLNGSLQVKRKIHLFPTDPMPALERIVELKQAISGGNCSTEALELAQHCWNSLGRYRSTGQPIDQLIDGMVQQQAAAGCWRSISAKLEEAAADSLPSEGRTLIGKFSWPLFLASKHLFRTDSVSAPKAADYLLNYTNSDRFKSSDFATAAYYGLLAAAEAARESNLASLALERPHFRLEARQVEAMFERLILSNCRSFVARLKPLIGPALFAIGHYRPSPEVGPALPILVDYHTCWSLLAGNCKPLLRGILVYMKRAASEVARQRQRFA